MRSLTDIEAVAFAALDARLDPSARRPFAVAFSGGGDSLALLLIADAWASARSRDLIVLHVDHRLQDRSAAWARDCEAVAARLGRPFRRLDWEGDKPAAGLAAAARAARHRLLADAARAAGCAVILMGHTADDRAEAAAMRAEGSTTPDPRVWSPSPAWPEGRGVFLLRPLLNVGRAALRDWLGARGETWIDDPANADPKSVRARVRRAGAGAVPPGPEPVPLRLADQVREAAGVLTVDRAVFREPDAARLLAMACVCAGGGSRLPSGDRVARLLDNLRSSDPFTATLAGARIEADDRDVRIFREAGETARSGLRAGPAHIWDGRWEILPADAPPVATSLPTRVRRTLPPMEGVAARSLVGERFRAAAGLVDREPA